MAGVVVSVSPGLHPAWLADIENVRGIAVNVELEIELWTLVPQV